MHSSRLFSAIGLVAVWGCAPVPGGGEEGSEGQLEARVKVGASVDVAGAASCSTVVVRGLSEQLVDEMNCMSPGLMESIEGMPGLGLGSAVMPYLQRGAAQALREAVSARGATIWVNSAYRTLPQQYLLHRWYQQGRCGIYLAARPGRSNHESGLAVDVESAESWRPALSRAGFRWLGYSDPVHFDYVRGGRDLRSISVLAFQRLWNRNHPEDRIAEDGDFGPGTESRLSRAPAAGFRRGSTCGVPSEDETSVDVDPGPEVSREMMDACRHVNGGTYAAGGCSSSYQCCGGEWASRGACGACTCIDPWGTSGCESAAPSTEPARPSPRAESHCGRFRDVPPDHPGYAAVEAMVRSGFMVGCSASPSIFCAEESITRAQAATVIASALALPLPSPSVYFADVSTAHWAASSIEALRREGIISGCTENRFCPDEPLSRAATAVILARMDGVPPDPNDVYSDVPDSHWASGAINALSRRDHIVRCRGDEFCPSSPTSRWIFADWLGRVLMLPRPSPCS